MLERFGETERGEREIDPALRRKALLLQQFSQEPLCRPRTAPWLNQKVEHLAFVVDRSPQPMFPATDFDDHLIEMPASARSRATTLKIASDQPPEFQEPAPDRLIRNVDATLGQQILDIAKRQGEPSVEPNRVLDNHGRKAMSLEGYRCHAVTVTAPDRSGHLLNVSMPLTRNMLLSFAQFEREVTGERIRDKIAASKKKGMWMGGFVPLGYEAKDRSLVINEAEAETVRTVFHLYPEHGNVRRVKEEVDWLRLATKIRKAENGRMRGGRPLSRGYIYKLLGNPLYAGRIAHKGEVYEGQHAAIIDAETWDAVQAKLAGNALDRRGQWIQGAEPARRDSS